MKQSHIVAFVTNLPNIMNTMVIMNRLGIPMMVTTLVISPFRKQLWLRLLFIDTIPWTAPAPSSFQTEHYSSHSINYCAMNSSPEKQGNKSLFMNSDNYYSSNSSQTESFRTLKNETKGSFYKLEEALHSSENCWNHGNWIAFSTGEILFSRKQIVFWMILSGHCLMNINCHCSWIVICPPAFLENCSLHSDWYCGMNSVLSGNCWVRELFME